jgi:hypothetical protein
MSWLACRGELFAEPAVHRMVVLYPILLFSAMFSRGRESPQNGLVGKAVAVPQRKIVGRQLDNKA